MKKYDISLRYSKDAKSCFFTNKSVKAESDAVTIEHVK